MSFTDIGEYHSKAMKPNIRKPMSSVETGGCDHIRRIRYWSTAYHCSLVYELVNPVLYIRMYMDSTARHLLAVKLVGG